MTTLERQVAAAKKAVKEAGKHLAELRRNADLGCGSFETTERAWADVAKKAETLSNLENALWLEQTFPSSVEVPS